MMKNISLLALLLVVGCSTSQVVTYTNDDVGLSKIESFGLVRSTTRDKLSEDQRLMDSVMLGVIKAELETLGYKASRRPGMFLEYSVVLNNSSESRVNQPNFYERRYYYPYNYNYNVTTYQYREGVVIVEAKDTAGKLLWQGSLNFKVGNSKKVSTRDLLINSVRQVAASFPPRN